MTLRRAQSMMEMKQLQKLLSLQGAKQDGASIPCHNLPVTKNLRFFGRENTIQTIDQYLRPDDTSKPLSSVALYGLGGIGKTQTALAYAYRKIESVDAVFWIAAEDSLSIQQSFTGIANQALQLPKASRQNHRENMVLVLDWLQKTAATWLVIFDNVDRHEDLDEIWPVSKHGAILVTTRDELVAALPIEHGIELNEFDLDDGAKFLLHMASRRKIANGERKATEKCAQELGGLPLAINQMAALINARNWSIVEFNEIYEKHRGRLHKEKKGGWKYLGYSHSLDTVWNLSFENLGNEARALLGVASFYSADNIPSGIFTPTATTSFPKILGFCHDPFSFGEALEQLTHHALIRRNISGDTYRVHRLVQEEFLQRLENAQEDFEAAIDLLVDKFPPPEGVAGGQDDDWIQVETYLPQVLNLSHKFDKAWKEGKSLEPTGNFVILLVNTAYCIHDNDTTNAVKPLLETADTAFRGCPESEKDPLQLAFIRSLECLFRLCESNFPEALKSAEETLSIRLKLLPPDDYQIASAYRFLGLAAASEGQYEKGLEYQLASGKILEGPAGNDVSRQTTWKYNTARNYYLMGRYEEANSLLTSAIEGVERRKTWYSQTYGYLTMTSLRVRQNRIDEARIFTDKAQHILETSGTLARFSWLSSYCAYRTAQVAALQNRVPEAIEQAERSVAIGNLTNVPPGIECRNLHAYSKILALDPTRQDEAEKQRNAARELRAKLPYHGGNLDDESDEAYEMLVKVDHR